MTDETPKRRWLQFRLRTLLIAVVVLSLPLSWFCAEMRRTKQQRMAAEALEKLGCEILLDRVALARGLGIPESVVGFPVWVKAKNLPLRDSDLRHFRELPEVEGIDLDNTDITDTGLFYFGNLARLRYLHLSNTQVTSAGLEHLKRLTKLQNLGLNGTLVTDAGIKHLKVLTNLHVLHLHNTGVTDTGMEQLKDLPNLEAVIVDESVTEADIKKLEQALPNCRIHRFGDAGK